MRGGEMKTVDGAEVSIERLQQHPEWIPLLAGWHHGQWASYNPGETLADRIARLKRHAADDALPLTWVAFSQGVLLGSASLVAADMEIRPELTPWLASVFVAPEHRRQGLGRSLVSHVTEQARLQGYRSLFLFTPDRELFYQQLGWQVVERPEFHGSQVAVMAFDLT
jgi:predicted N-acetyltransferase YhbS